ncbi:unnamed protein product, partial [Meganyctiphanes norvegica]
MMALFMILIILLKQKEVSCQRLPNTAELFHNALEDDRDDNYIVQSVFDKPQPIAVNTAFALLDIYRNSSAQKKNPTHAGANLREDSCEMDEYASAKLDKSLKVLKEDWFSIFEADHKIG